MVQSTRGTSHAINPKTKKTYCGRDPTLEDHDWRVLDVVPSDEHQPTCKICQRHYDEPLKEALRKMSQDLKSSIADFLDRCWMLKDVDGLGRFASTISKFLDEEVKRRKGAD